MRGEPTAMSELEPQLRQLIQEACSHPPGDLKRQRALTQIIRLVTDRLWRENTPNYQDALQQTWVFFCQNICESTTGERYNPERSSVITWLNYYLKRRLQDAFINNQKQQIRRATPQLRQSRSGDVELIDPIENLAAEPESPSLLDEVRAWAEDDISGKLGQIYIEGHRHVTAQLLILKRLPPETSWKQLSAELGLSISTLSSFYQRQCLPRLRKFGESEGYL